MTTTETETPETRGECLQTAFNRICNKAIKADLHYVVLVETVQAYGGPEEGGWWYDKNIIHAYQAFVSEELAEKAAEGVKKLAKELEAEARKEHGEHCLQQMEWLDQRGLESDYLPEDDGPATYSVLVTDEVPQYDNTRPEWS